MTSIFKDVPMGPKDPMYDLRLALTSDTTPEKIDLGAGVYRNEEGKYYELPVIKKAKKILEAQNLGHDYGNGLGAPSFLSHARTLLFGPVANAPIASVQTTGGSGANSLGASFLKKFLPGGGGGGGARRVYIGVPAWGNYHALFKHAGFEVHTYQYLDERRSVDFARLVSTVSEAPSGSVFVLQGCCHNPSGRDLRPEEWRDLAAVIREAGQVPFLDIAYQGFGDGLDEDAYGVRYFVEFGFEMLVCQSFSKNMGLYGERVGVLHAVVRDEGDERKVVASVRDQLRCLIRWTVSSPPAFGSRLADLVMGEELRTEWLEQLDAMRLRLKYNRAELHRLLTEVHNTPGDWQHLIEEKGLFSYPVLSSQQVFRLRSDFHVYLPENGRINVAGLGPKSLEPVAKALNAVVRGGTS